MSELGVHRRLAAILAADVVGYSRLMGEDETGTLAALRAHLTELIQPLVDSHEGRIVKLMGDGVLAEFPSALEAVRCAIEIQTAMAERNDDVSEGRQIQFRIGVNLGDVISEADDIYGDGVNVAARLEELAKPGGICLSSMVHVQIQNKVDVGLKDLGEQELKNITYPVHVFSVVLNGEETPIPEQMEQRHRLTRVQLAGSVIVALVLIAGGAVLWLRPWEPDMEPASVERMAFALPDKPSMAVLPFNNMSDDTSQEYFVDGMTEDLITDLSKVSGLFVIARNSSFVYKGQQAEVRKIAEDLGVRYVLEGSVRRSGNQVRINVQLIDATTGGHVWAERYNELEDDVFLLQDRVLREIVEALRVKLTDVDKDKLDHRPKPVNLTAYDWLLKGRKKLAEQDRQSAAMAKTYFEKAIEADPTYARAYANLGFYYWNEWRLWGQDKRKNLASAQEIGQKAADLDPGSAAAAVLLAITYQYQGDHAQAEIWADKAMTLEPTLAETLGNLGGYLRHANRYHEATEVLLKAMRLDPLHPPHWLSWLGHAYFMDNKSDEAISVLRDAVAREPNYIANHVYLAGIYADSGKLENAAAEVKEVLRLDKNFTVSAFERYFASNTKDPSREQRLSAALRKAGLPE